MASSQLNISYMIICKLQTYHLSSILAWRSCKIQTLLLIVIIIINDFLTSSLSHDILQKPEEIIKSTRQPCWHTDYNITQCTCHTSKKQQQQQDMPISGQLTIVQVDNSYFQATFLGQSMNTVKNVDQNQLSNFQTAQCRSLRLQTVMQSQGCY